MLLENKHYYLVKNLSRLMSMQTSKHHREIVICRRCLNHFPNDKALEKHEENCQNHDAIKIVLPEKGHNLRIKKPQVFDESANCGLCRLWVIHKTD